MKAIISIMMILAVSLSAVTIEVTPEEQARIVLALRIVSALEDGSFHVVTTATNGASYTRSLVVMGKTYVFIDTLTIKSTIPRHVLGLAAGMGFSAFYGYRLFTHLGIFADADTVDGGNIRGGLFLTF